MLPDIALPDDGRGEGEMLESALRYSRAYRFISLPFLCRLADAATFARFCLSLCRAEQQPPMVPARRARRA